MVLLARLGSPGASGTLTAPGLSAVTGINEPTVSKVLKILSHGGLVEGLRGARGGYRLSRPLSVMPLSDVIVAMDGPIALTACVDGASGACESECHCPVRGRWDAVNDAIRDALSAVTVADLAGFPPTDSDPTCKTLHAPRAPQGAPLAAE